MVNMRLDPSRTSKSTGLQTKAILSAVTNFESFHCSNGSLFTKGIFVYIFTCVYEILAVIGLLIKKCKKSLIGYFKHMVCLSKAFM